jgi:hypothetical protein
VFSTKGYLESYFTVIIYYRSCLNTKLPPIITKNIYLQLCTKKMWTFTNNIPWPWQFSQLCISREFFKSHPKQFVQKYKVAAWHGMAMAYKKQA